MTEYPYILFNKFNKSPEQMRQLGACGGRAYARNQRARRALVATPPEAVPPPALPQQTTAEDIQVLDTQFPWLRVRKGNAPEIESGSPRPPRQRIKTSDARGDRTRTSAWIPATTARRGWSSASRRAAARIWMGNPRRASLLSASAPPGCLRRQGLRPQPARPPRRAVPRSHPPAPIHAAQYRSVWRSTHGTVEFRRPVAVAADYLAFATRFAEPTGGGAAGRAHRAAPPVW